MERQHSKTEDKLHNWSQRMLAPNVEDWTNEQLIALNNRVIQELDRRFNIRNYERGLDLNESENESSSYY